MNEKIEVGGWASYLYEVTERSPYLDQYGYRQYIHKKKRAYGKVVAIEGDRVTLESWEMAKITRRSKAFGQPIDKTPYREGGIYYIPLADLTPAVGGLARQLQVKLDAVMRYPTRRERDNARRKRNAARKAGVR